MTELNKIHNCDCYEYMQKVPDGFFDLVLTDPPYEITLGDKNGDGFLAHKKYKGEDLKNISNGFDVDLVLNECLRISKKCNMFIFCSNKQITKLMNWGEKTGFYTTLLIWNKYNSIPFANGVWRSDAEFIVHIRENGATFNGGIPLKNKIATLPLNPSEFGHPTEKPLKLMEKYILVGSNEGDVIFDPFMGSGTTAVAAKSLNRNFVGCEIDENYCKIANKRVESVQTRMVFDV
jgi:DNA modification methylase